MVPSYSCPRLSPSDRSASIRMVVTGPPLVPARGLLDSPEAPSSTPEDIEVESIGDYPKGWDRPGRRTRDARAAAPGLEGGLPGRGPPVARPPGRAPPRGGGRRDPRRHPAGEDGRGRLCTGVRREGR